MCTDFCQFSSGAVDFHFQNSKFKFMQANHMHFAGTDSTLVGAVFFLWQNIPVQEARMFCSVEVINKNKIVILI